MSEAPGKGKPNMATTKEKSESPQASPPGPVVPGDSLSELYGGAHGAGVESLVGPAGSAQGIPN